MLLIAQAGTLKAAKKRNHIDFPGRLLLFPTHQDVRITITGSSPAPSAQQSLLERANAALAGSNATTPPSTQTKKPSFATFTPKRAYIPEDDEDEDDGWGSEPDAPTTAAAPTAQAPKAVHFTPTSTATATATPSPSESSSASQASANSSSMSPQVVANVKSVMNNVFKKLKAMFPGGQNFDVSEITASAKKVIVETTLSLGEDESTPTVKEVMNRVYKQLRTSFSSAPSFSANEILDILRKTIVDTTNSLTSAPAASTPAPVTSKATPVAAPAPAPAPTPKPAPEPVPAAEPSAPVKKKWPTVQTHQLNKASATSAPSVVSTQSPSSTTTKPSWAKPARKSSAEGKLSDILKEQQDFEALIKEEWSSSQVERYFEAKYASIRSLLDTHKDTAAPKTSSTTNKTPSWKKPAQTTSTSSPASSSSTSSTTSFSNPSSSSTSTSQKPSWAKSPTPSWVKKPEPVEDTPSSDWEEPSPAPSTAPSAEKKRVTPSSSQAAEPVASPAIDSSSLSLSSKLIEQTKARINQSPGSREVDLRHPDILAAYLKMRDDNDPTKWMIMGYKGTKNVLHVLRTGSGNFQEFVDAITDEPLFMYLNYCFGDTARSKFVFVSYVPDFLGGLVKSRVVGHRAKVEEFIKYMQITWNILDIEELEEDELVKKLLSAGGANYSVQDSNKSNFSSYKNTTKSFYEKKDKESKVKIVFDQGPLTTTPVDLSGRPMVASATDAQRNTSSDFKRKH